ncbi:MAG: hypothetical protein JXA11_12080 [Phycisphaerae bacterium]|nr:hypothetical protein [Phycisphaerae bacterium]
MKCPINARLRPGEYSLDARTSFPGTEELPSRKTFRIRIVPRPSPLRMQTFMLWGDMPLDTLQEVGLNTFTPGTSGRNMADTQSTWEADGPLERPMDDDSMGRMFMLLNEALARGLDVYARCEPPGRIASWQKIRKYYRVDNRGKQYKDRIRQNVLHPDLQAYANRYGASLGRAYGDFPAFIGAFVHSEERGRTTAPSFDKYSRDAFQKDTALKIPPQVSGPKNSRGLHYKNLRDFPADRVIREDDPLYVYYRWFWKTGDGWNSLNTRVRRGMEAEMKRPAWSFHAPAVRVPSVYGSGGDITHLGQWSYAFPGPINYDMPTNELLAMAHGTAPPQEVLPIISVFLPRVFVMPADPKELEKYTQTDLDPHAAYYPMTADQMRGAFWNTISYPVQGVGWYGIANLIPDTEGEGYHSPELLPEMTRLLRNVVAPLGPTLLQVPDRPADVAFLESFSSEMFAGRGTYGWGYRGWSDKVYRMLLHAHVQPDIIYEETVLKQGLDQYRMLVMMHCDVLPKSVVKKVLAFQKRGGIIVGDSHLPPAIRPDLLIRDDRRTSSADSIAREVKGALKLRKKLNHHYLRYVDCKDPEILLRVRQYGDSDYIFVINNHLRAGDYLGRYGRIREYGVPAKTKVFVRRKKGYVYDLVNGETIPVDSIGGMLRIPIELGPCQGRLLMITDAKIEGVTIDAPDEMRRNTPVKISLRVVDENNQPVKAVIPLRVDITNAEGQPAEFSGFYGAKDGCLTIEIIPALNDILGEWTITVTELASGNQVRKHVHLIP